MMRSACREGMPGRDDKSSFEPLFRSTDLLLLRPSLMPWAMAFVSRLTAAVSSAVFCRIWSGLWLVQAAPSPKHNPTTNKKYTREFMVFRCWVQGCGCRRCRMPPTLGREEASILLILCAPIQQHEKENSCEAFLPQYFREPCCSEP